MPLYIGSFSFQKQKPTTKQKGEFQILITAESFEDALEKFRKQIEHTRATSNLLSGKIRIDLDRILELPVPPTQAVMINFQYQDVVTQSPLVVQPIPEDNDSIILYSFHKQGTFLEKPEWSATEFIAYSD